TNGVVIEDIPADGLAPVVLIQQTAAIRQFSILRKTGVVRYAALHAPYGRFTKMTTNGSLNRKFRMALVGGGHGAFIGRVHATAAVMDNRAELVAGCLSSNPDRAKASAPDYDIKPDRA